MPAPLQACLIGSLREEFFEGVNGDVTLKFIHDENVVESRKCHGFLINKVEYFSAQSHFLEGGAKEFKIDIGSFYEGCKIGFKQFVEATFLVLFGGSAKDLKLDFGSKYSVIRFREYLGFDFDDLCADDFCYYEFLDMTVDNIKEARKAMMLMLRHCSEEVATKVVESDAHKLQVTGNTFAERWAHLYSMVKESSADGRLTPIGKVLCRFLCARYHEQNTDGDGFGDGLIKCIALHYEAGVSIVKEHEVVDVPNCELVVDMWDWMGKNHLRSWKDMPVTASEHDPPKLPPNEFIDSFKCDSETTIFDLQAMSFLLSVAVRPIVTDIFLDKLMEEPEEVLAAGDGEHRSELQERALQREKKNEQKEHNGCVRDLVQKGDDVICDKLHEVHKELASRVMKLTEANADLTKRLEKLESTVTGSKRRREE